MIGNGFRKSFVQVEICILSCGAYIELFQNQRFQMLLHVVKKLVSAITSEQKNQCEIMLSAENQHRPREG